MLLVQFFDGFRIKNTLIPQPIRLLLNFFGIMRRNHFLKFKNRRIGFEVLHHLKYMKLSRSEYRFLCFHSQIIINKFSTKVMIIPLLCKFHTNTLP